MPYTWKEGDGQNIPFTIWIMYVSRFPSLLAKYILPLRKQLMRIIDLFFHTALLPLHLYISPPSLGGKPFHSHFHRLQTSSFLPVLIPELMIHGHVNSPTYTSKRLCRMHLKFSCFRAVKLGDVECQPELKHPKTLRVYRWLAHWISISVV